MSVLHIIVNMSLKQIFLNKYIKDKKIRLTYRKLRVKNLRNNKQSM
jgi:hypothetical protein